MALHESGEDYLEAILMVRQEKGYCRSIDVAHHLNVSKPSVSVAMKKLRENNLITVDGDGYIHLTEDGLAIANRMYERHKLLSDWLTYLGVPKDIATEDACRIEHVISQESFEKIRAHVREMNEHL